MVIIFPKEDSYKNKSDEYKSRFRLKVKSVLEEYEKFEGMQFYYFKEDWIADELLPTSSDRYHGLTCYSAMSRMFASKYTSLHENCYMSKPDTRYDDIISAVDKECRIQLPDSVDQEAVIKANIQNLLNKRRIAVSKILELEENIILYFDYNNQYCNLRQPTLGDLRLIHLIHLKEDTEEFWYSGQYLDKQLFFKVVKEILQYG